MMAEMLKNRLWAFFHQKLVKYFSFDEIQPIFVTVDARIYLYNSIIYMVNLITSHILSFSITNTSPILNAPGRTVTIRRPQPLAMRTLDTGTFPD